MAYTPTEWQTGDIVTAEKLNKLENGVADSSGGILAVNLILEEDSSVPSLDKTYAEIASAIENNKQVVVFNKLSPILTGITAHPVYSVGGDDEYTVRVLAMIGLGVGLATYVAEEEDAYPIYQSDGDGPIS